MAYNYFDISSKFFKRIILPTPTLNPRPWYAFPVMEPNSEMIIDIHGYHYPALRGFGWNPAQGHDRISCSQFSRKALRQPQEECQTSSSCPIAGPPWPPHAQSRNLSRPRHGHPAARPGPRATPDRRQSLRRGPDRALSPPP
jgi:hypothetical protein